MTRRIAIACFAAAAWGLVTEGNPSAVAATPTPTSTPTPTPAMVTVTVKTRPTGRSFSVDGTTYTAQQRFRWSNGSTHTIATTSPQSGDPGVQYVWNKWSDQGAISHTVAPTSNTTYTARFKTQYYLTMTAGTGGSARPTSGWRNSGASVPITARPANGYSFSNWIGTGTGSYSGPNNPAAIMMSGPITETATFTGSSTPTPTPSPSPTATATATPTPTATPTATATPTPTPAFAADDFNRPDGGLGLNWTKPLASENNLVIVNNQVGVDVEDSHNYAFWSADSFSEDQYSQIIITKMGNWPGVIVRADDILDRFYLGLLSGPNDYRIYRRWDGGYYQVAIGTTETWQVGDTLMLGVTGSVNPVTVTLYHNGNAVLSWTSSSQAEVKNGGNPGIGIYSPSGYALTLDNWEGGQLVADTQPPSAPANLVATTIGVSQVHLSWTASTDNVSVTGYRVERQDPGSPSFAQVGTTTATSYNDTGLTAGNSYSYRVRAIDAAQNLSEYSEAATATTLAGIAATDDFNRADGGLGLNWAKPLPASEQTLVIVNNQVTPDIQSAHCYAYWTGNTFNQDQYSQAQIRNVGAWNGVIARAQPSIDRFYMAFVFSPNDYRLYLRKDGLYYSLATGSTETWVAGDVIRLEASGVNPVQLTLLRNGNPVLTYTDTTENLVGGSPGIGIYSPSGDHLAIDNWEGGNLGMLGILLPETQEPSVPGNLAATPLGVSQVKLAWAAATDKVGVRSYEVQRQDPGSTSFVHVGTTTGTSYTDTGLAAGSDYTYRVLVADARGNLQEYSGVASVTTASPAIGPRRSR